MHRPIDHTVVLQAKKPFKHLLSCIQKKVVLLQLVQ